MESRTLRTLLLTLVPALAVTLLATPASAQIEVEIDPIAYALHGFSLHVGKVTGRTRLDVGTFGLRVPQAVHGNDGWRSSARGVGLKLDYLGSNLNGLFVGLDGGYAWYHYTLEAKGTSVKQGVPGMGIRGGYRLPIGRAGLYVVPWMSVSYNVLGSAVAIGGDRFDRNAIELFPTVHIGWSF